MNGPDRWIVVELIVEKFRLEHERFRRVFSELRKKLFDLLIFPFVGNLFRF